MGVSKFRSEAIDTATPTKLNGILAGDGSNVVVLAPEDLSHGMYGVCSTAGETAAKTVSIDGLTALETGLSLRVKFTYGNTAANPTLNVNSLGAVSIKKHGTTAAASGDWEDGAVVILVYDGVYWQISGSSQSSPFYAGTTAPSDTRKLWIDTANGLKYWDGNAWVTVPVGYSS